MCNNSSLQGRSQTASTTFYCILIMDSIALHRESITPGDHDLSLDHGQEQLQQGQSRSTYFIT